MPSLLMIITNAGFDALVDAQGGGSDNIQITYMGLTDTPFIMAPTLTALPGQFKTIETFAGQTISENIIHLSAYDTSDETYDVTGFGLYLDDGTLFAAYSSETDPILSKAELAWSLFSHDITFDSTADIDFGDASFLNPPASETVKGVARIATEELADEGLDLETIMPPALVKRLIDAYAQSVVDKMIPPRCPVAWYPETAMDPVPTGWLLCDGTNGTPDLRDRFVVGAGGDFEVGDTGGSDTHGHGGSVGNHALTEAELPAHRHFVAVSGTGAATLTSGNSISEITTAGENREYELHSLAGEPSIGRTSATGSGNEHGHGLTIDNATTLPPYYALAYIMKA
jgi:microcystin-dependent protein